MAAFFYARSQIREHYFQMIAEMISDLVFAWV